MTLVDSLKKKTPTKKEASWEWYKLTPRIGLKKNRIALKRQGSFE